MENMSNFETTEDNFHTVSFILKKENLMGALKIVVGFVDGQQTDIIVHIQEEWGL